MIEFMAFALGGSKTKTKHAEVRGAGLAHFGESSLFQSCAFLQLKTNDS